MPKLFVYCDQFTVKLTPSQIKFIEKHIGFPGYFTKAQGNDAEVYREVTFGELVEHLIEETDLLIEHDKI